MEKVTLDAQTLYGITARTNNQAEMTPSGKIGPLWQNFYDQLGKKGIMPTVGYGVYSNYESDHLGDFDITVAQIDAADLEGEQAITVPAATYLRFEKSGECPQACIDLWKEIWEYFEQKGAPKRSYTVDYEEYLSMNNVAIYIGIEA